MRNFKFVSLDPRSGGLNRKFTANDKKYTSCRFPWISYSVPLATFERDLEFAFLVLSSKTFTCSCLLPFRRK